MVGVITLAIGLFAGYILNKNHSERTVGNAEQTAKNMISDAERHVEALKKERVIEAKEEAHKIKKEIDEEIRERRAEIQKSERRLVQKEESLDRKIENIERKEENITRKEKAIIGKEQELDVLVQRQNEELVKISGYTKDEAKEIRTEASVLIKEIEAEAREKGEVKAREIITGAIQRCAADHVAETTVSVVPLPNDDMKGRIIGREGRNIRAIETLTGVDLIIDDTPEAVVLSGFDPVKRSGAYQLGEAHSGRANSSFAH